MMQVNRHNTTGWVLSAIEWVFQLLFTFGTSRN